MTAIAATIKNGNYAAAARRSDPQGAVVNAAADEATVTADITAALANGTISGDGTALGLVTQIQTDFATLVADLAAGGTTASNVLLSYDPSKVLTKNMLRQAVEAIMLVVAGGNDLT